MDTPNPRSSAGTTYSNIKAEAGLSQLANCKSCQQVLCASQGWAVINFPVPQDTKED